MGIPSLNSAILYCVSLYFHISSQETSRHHANITNIPDLVQENATCCGRDMTIQSGHISGHKLKCVKAVR